MLGKQTSLCYGVAFREQKKNKEYLIFCFSYVWHIESEDGKNKIVYGGTEASVFNTKLTAKFNKNSESQKVQILPFIATIQSFQKRAELKEFTFIFLPTSHFWIIEKLFISQLYDSKKNP